MCAPSHNARRRLAGRNVSPRPIGITIDGLFASRWNIGDSIPDFVWDIPTGWPGGKGFGVVGQLLDRFALIVFDDDNRIQIDVGLPPSSITINADRASWHPNDAQWELMNRTATTQLNWVVAGWSSATGNVDSPYWSDAVSFAVQR